MMDISTLLMLSSVAILVAFGAALYFASLDDEHEFRTTPPRSSKGKSQKAVEESPARSPRPQNTKRPNKKKSEQSESDKKICEAILAEIEWRDQLDELCQEFPFQISDFDPKALRLLDEYFAEGALDSAFDALKESAQNQPRNNIQNTRRYIYTLLRRVDREVYGKYKLKSRAEQKDDVPIRTPQKKSRGEKNSLTVSDFREMLLSEPREQAPARTKSSSLSPGKIHSFNAKAEEFEPGRRSHGCVEFVPGAISHGLLPRAAAAL